MTDRDELHCVISDLADREGGMASEDVLGRVLHLKAHISEENAALVWTDAVIPLIDALAEAVRELRRDVQWAATRGVYVGLSDEEILRNVRAGRIDAAMASRGGGQE